MSYDTRRKVPKPTPLMKKVVKAAYPEYNGRKYSVETRDSPISIRSYWDEGSRHHYRFVRLDTLAVLDPGTSHPYFDAHKVGVDSVTIPEGCVVVEHSIFCGKDVGVCIHVPVSDRRLLPEPEQVIGTLEVA